MPSKCSDKHLWYTMEEQKRSKWILSHSNTTVWPTWNTIHTQTHLHTHAVHTQTHRRKVTLYLVITITRASKRTPLWWRCTTNPVDCEREIKWLILTVDDRSWLQWVLAFSHRPLLKRSLEINFMPDLVHVGAWMHLGLISSTSEPLHLALSLTMWKRK